MTAKHKLNRFHVAGSSAIAAVFGLLSGSWVVFFLFLGVLLATASYTRAIRA